MRAQSQLFFTSTKKRGHLPASTTVWPLRNRPKGAPFTSMRPGIPSTCRTARESVRSMDDYIQSIASRRRRRIGNTCWILRNLFEIWLFVVFNGVRGRMTLRRHEFYPGIQILRISPSVRAILVTIGTRNEGSRSCGRIRERRYRESLLWAVNQSASDALIRKTNKP
jgi:hypothetical protein